MDFKKTFIGPDLTLTTLTPENGQHLDNPKRNEREEMNPAPQRGKDENQVGKKEREREKNKWKKRRKKKGEESKQDPKI